MVLLHRIRQAKLDDFSRLFKRFYFQIHGPSFANHQASKGIAYYCNNQIIKPKYVSIYWRPADLFSSTVRFFAVPVQVISVVLFRLVFLKFRLIVEILLRFFEKSLVMNLGDPQFLKKVEVKEQPKGHRLNEQIKAEFVRLVTDEGAIVCTFLLLLYFMIINIPFMLCLMIINGFLFGVYVSSMRSVDCINLFQVIEIGYSFLVCLIHRHFKRFLIKKLSLC